MCISTYGKPYSTNATLRATQVAVPINAALAKLRDAGAVLVPFDSSAFQKLAVSAWPGATEETINTLDAASAYESIEVLGR